MEQRVVQLQHLPPVERVVPVNQPHNFPIRTLFMDLFVNVLHGLLVGRVDDDFDFVFGDGLVAQVLLDVVASAVGGVVVDVHDVVISVILHEHGVEVAEVQAGFDVVVRGHNDAEAELVVFVGFDLVVFIVVSLFHLHNASDGCFLGSLVLIERRHFDIDVSVKIHIMRELGQKHSP